MWRLFIAAILSVLIVSCAGTKLQKSNEGHGK